MYDEERVKRLAASCDTETLQKCLDDPINAKDPQQRADNEKTIRIIREELERRKGASKC